MFYIYEVFVKSKKRKRSANHYSAVEEEKKLNAEKAVKAKAEKEAATAAKKAQFDPRPRRWRTSTRRDPAMEPIISKIKEAAEMLGLEFRGSGGIVFAMCVCKGSSGKSRDREVQSGVE